MSLTWICVWCNFEKCIAYTNKLLLHTTKISRLTLFYCLSLQDRWRINRLTQYQYSRIAVSGETKIMNLCHETKGNRISLFRCIKSAFLELGPYQLWNLFFRINALSTWNKSFQSCLIEDFYSRVIEFEMFGIKHPYTKAKVRVRDKWSLLKKARIKGL